MSIRAGPIGYSDQGGPHRNSDGPGCNHLPGLALFASLGQVAAWIWLWSELKKPWMRQ
jgi:hypothetical protein